MGRQSFGQGASVVAGTVDGVDVVDVACTVVVGVDSMTSTSRLATRAKAAETPAASSADVTGPNALRLARSVSSVVRLIVSTLMSATAATASSSPAVLPSSFPSDRMTSTLL